MDELVIDIPLKAVAGKGRRAQFFREAAAPYIPDLKPSVHDYGKRYTLSVYFHYVGECNGDMDNRLACVFDALKGKVIYDDFQVKELYCRMVENSDATRIQLRLKELLSAKPPKPNTMSDINCCKKCCSGGIVDHFRKHDEGMECDCVCHIGGQTGQGVELTLDNIKRGAALAAQSIPPHPHWGELEKEFDYYFEGSYGTGFPVMQHRIKTWLQNKFATAIQKERDRLLERLEKFELPEGVKTQPEFGAFIVNKIVADLRKHVLSERSDDPKHHE